MTIREDTVKRAAYEKAEERRKAAGKKSLPEPKLIVATWYVEGKKKLKYFYTKTDAKRFRTEESKKIKDLGSHSSYTAEQIADWARLHNLALEANTTLEACLQGWVHHLQKVTQITLLSDAISSYLETISNLATRKGKESKLNKLLGHFPRHSVDQVAEQAISYLDTLSKTLASKTVDNHQRDLSAFFTFCKKRKMLAENPLLGITDFTHVETRETDYYSANEVKVILTRLMSDFDIHIASSIILQLFAGIRPAELAKKTDSGWVHLTWENVFHNRGIYITAELAKAMNKKKIKHRFIPRNETLKAWLAWLQEQNKAPLSGAVITSNLRVDKRFRDKHDDLKAIMQNRRGSVMRHTYATYAFETTDSKASTARALGNSESVLEKNYLSGDESLKDEAEAFWKLTPDFIQNVASKELLKVV